jgi:hypothetical protein
VVERQIVHRGDGAHPTVEQCGSAPHVARQGNHLMAILQQRAHQMLADEACGPGDQHAAGDLVEDAQGAGRCGCGSSGVHQSFLAVRVDRGEAGLARHPGTWRCTAGM